MINVCIVHPWPYPTHLSPWGLLQIFKTPIPFKTKPANVVGFSFSSVKLFVAHKKFGNEWHIVRSLTWRSGSRDLQAGCGAHPLPLQSKQALGYMWERVGDRQCFGKSLRCPFLPFLSIPSALGALTGRGALPFGVERIKKMWLCTNLPFVSAFTKLHFIKRQSHFPGSSCFCSDLPSRAPVIPKVWFSSSRK